MGFDYGTKRLGVAIGQTLTAQANPLCTLKMVQQRPDWDGIKTLIDEWQPQQLIVGIPYNMDDTATFLTARTERFARQLNGRYGLPSEGIDERLTSKAARLEFTDSLEKNGGIDAFAAKLILETWLTEYHE